MEILPIDIGMAVRMTGQSLKRIRLAPLNWTIAMMMAHASLNENRQIVADLLRLRRANYSGQLRETARAHQNVIYTDTSWDQRKDGLVKESTLYYAIAKDLRNGKKSIYWSRDPEHLRTKKLEDGSEEFIHDNFRYYWDTLPDNATKIEIRQSIERHSKGFRIFGLYHMAMHGGDVSDTHSPMLPVNGWKENNLLQNGYRYKTYAFSNDDFNAVVRENHREHGGGWSFELGRPFERFQNLKGFVETDGIPKHKKFLKAFFSNGSVISTHNTREEAFANMFMAINDRSQINWRGFKPINIEKAFFSDITTKLWNLGTKEVKDEENREEAEFDTGFGLLIGLASRAAISYSFLGALAAGAFANFTMRKVLGAYKGLKKEYLWLRHGAASVDRNRAPYILHDKENVRVRLYNTKPDPVTNTFMNVLRGDNIDLTYDDQKQTDPREKFKIQKLLSQLDDTGFSRMSMMIDLNTSTEIFFNGFIRLNHRDSETGKLTTYVKYVKSLDVNPNIAMGEDVKKYFKDGQTQKIVRFKGAKKLHMQEVDFEELDKNISSCLFQGCTALPDSATTAARGHIQWLFNNTAAHSEAEKEPVKEVTNTINDTGHISNREEIKRGRTLKSLFGKRKPNIAKPSAELVAYFKDCVMPFPSVAVKQFTALQI